MKSRNFRTIMVLGLFLMLVIVVQKPASMSANSQHPWPLWRNNAQLTGTSSIVGPVNPDIKWSYNTGSGLSLSSSALVAMDGTVYIGTYGNGLQASIHAIDQAGNLKWSFTAPGKFEFSLALADDGSVYGFANTTLYALLPNGSLKWSLDLGAVSYGAITIGPDAAIYIPIEGAVVTVNPDGSNKWVRQVDEPPCPCYPTTIAIGSDGIIYTTVIKAYSPPGADLYALDAAGSLIWRTYVYRGGSPPSIGPDGTLYVGGGYGGTLTAIQPSDGAIDWVFATSEFGLNQGMAISTDGTIYFGTSNINSPGPYGFLWAVNPDGTLKWRYPPLGSPEPGYAYTAPLVDGDGTIYIGYSGGSLRAIDPDGSLKWIVNCCGVPRGSPTLGTDRTVYIPFNNSVVAIGEGNQPPTVNAGGPYSGYEGTATALADATAYDEDGDSLSYHWTVNTSMCVFSDPATINSTVTCYDNGNFTVALTVDDGVNAPVSDEVAVTVQNIAPSVDIVSVPVDPLNITDQAAYTVDVTFSDPAGVNDEPYFCGFDLENDGVVDVTVDDVTGSACNTPIDYAEPGVYTVKATVTDKDGGTGSATATNFVVIYNPTGGFVTGGGWIIPGSQTSDPGGVLPGLDGTSKANFGFVVKYNNGASTIPGGNLDFHYNVGSFHLHSADMEWLVVTNDIWAHFQGTAAIDGIQGLYPFRVDARDADTDRFVIKIYAPGADPDTEEPIYKASGDLLGGQIKIHRR